MAMALASFSLKNVIVAPPRAPCCLTSGFENKSFATFGGLKARPMIKQKLAAKELPTTKFSRSVRIVCAAEVKTLDKVQKIVAKQLAVDPTSVAPSSKFSDLGADSLDTVEIVMALEEEYQITIEDEGAEKIATVQDAADLIQDIISRQASSL
ncbi:hypothetical protein O6H91_12G098300 [Diphasiastrum complanatum]|uniref:Uncharacterized protein n=1 Tax=Diphasiastrum complanatum TaxID=34168 RepID=A0ACC2C575_DIPCM|nr:hypothetical protein O6H91_12G098300 [Diphasiastrum complanatum]